MTPLDIIRQNLLKIGRKTQDEQILQWCMEIQDELDDVHTGWLMFRNGQPHSRFKIDEQEARNNALSWGRHPELDVRKIHFIEGEIMDV